MERKLAYRDIENFKDYLYKEEKSSATIEKYVRDVVAFYRYAGDLLQKNTVIEYKKKIAEEYATRSVNSMIASINAFFSFLGREELKVKALKQQKTIFCTQEKELSKEEYIRLCNTAEEIGNDRLSLIIQTICGTGIRVSELEFITVEAIKKGKATVDCKGKRRTIFIVKKLQKKLLCYIYKQGIKSGSIFITRTGKPISRTNIWREMKRICKKANVNPSKVFPHNLRHLFARMFYTIEKDIAKLADLLGHSSINTTRIYIMSTGEEHIKRLEHLNLII